VRTLILFFIVSLGLIAVTRVSAEQSTAAPARTFDESKAASNGIRKLTGKHLVLFTDVPSSPDVDRLPQVFDAAVPLWCAYFGVDPAKTEGWMARGYLIGDRRRFDALGLMPPGHDKFENGISMGAEFWLHDQPTPYYRRHLLLHEGTHVFMVSFLGGCGPGWFMEGTAELLATHRLDEKTGKLELRIMPRDRGEVPMLGRIKLINDAIAAGHPMSLSAVMQLDNSQQLGNEAYAWCWAAAKLLDTHPRYRERFRKLKTHVLDPAFNDLVRREFKEDRPDLNAEWEALINSLDHNYDFERMAIDFRRGEPVTVSAPRKVEIAADHGWQSSGVRLEAGKSYKITAKGQYQIVAEQVDGKTRVWPCEPGGVTIEYYRGHPLGMLLGAIVPDSDTPPDAKLSFAAPAAIGLEATLKPTATGTLYLRVNDSGGRLEDNRGTLTATIQEVPNTER
jgi:hypothetical protein